MEIKPFENKVWLAKPTMHGDEEINALIDTIKSGWISTVGPSINAIETDFAEMLGVKYAVALSCGTAALHLAVKLAGEKIYGMPKVGHGVLENRYFMCSDMTFDATVNPGVYENGTPIFIDSERDTLNMDAAALEKAFLQYPETKIVMLAHLYGTPAKYDEIKSVCDKYGAIIIEDAAESLGATYKGRQTGSLSVSDDSYSVISFNGNKIITGSSGGMLLTNSKEDADKARKWSTQSREAAPWYEHEELGYNYRISTLQSSLIGVQRKHLSEHISRKRDIYFRYKEGFKGLPVTMNPYDAENSEPNFWLSCMIINQAAMCRQVRSDREALYIHERGKTCPTEILETLAKYNAEGRPIWKPMHSQPIYSNNPFFTAQGNGRGRTNAYISGGEAPAVDEDIFNRGLCLPSDINMTAEEQDIIIQIIRSCFE